ncbi:MAG: ZIP family metal transporter [Anaerolineales bacterium]|jgi:ZIP family zinc transporter
MDPILIQAVIAATITMLATGIGGLPFVFVRRIPESIAGMSWAFAGGMMLSASVFNLIIPGVNDGGILQVAFGVLAGTLIFGLASRYIDHHDFTLSGINDASAKRVTLILATMFFHSIPEGLAVGVAYGSGETNLGLIMAIAISIHNIPEGVAVSLPLRADGVSGWKCVGWSIFSSLPQPIATIPAYLAVVAFREILPFAFGLAAGAMFFLVLSEMIPESRANHDQRQFSAIAAMAGFLAMMLLQNVLVV